MARLNVPEVPYQAYPTEVPSGQLPALSVRTDPAAFGANVAGAIQHMGGQMAHVGDELFARAIELKQQQAETNVNAKATNFILGGSQSAEKFKLLEGNNASNEALMKQHADLNDMRNKARAGLSPFEQRLFDRETLTPFRQFVVSASSHAATEQRRYMLDTEKASRETVKRTLEQNPDNGSTLDDTVERVDGSLRREQKVRGESEEWFQNERAKELSSIRSAQIAGMVHKDPVKAEAMRQKAEEQHLLTPEDSNRAWSKVQTQLPSVVSDTIMHNVTAHPEGPGNSPHWTSEAARYEGEQDERATRPLRQLAIDRPDLRVAPAPNIRPTVPGGRGIDFMSNNNDEAAKAIEETTRKLGIPLVVSNMGSYVHVELPKDYDTSTAPAPTPQSEESRVSIGATAAAEANPTNPRQADHATATIMRGISRQKTHERDQQQSYSNAIASVVLQDGETVIQSMRELPLKLQERYRSTEAWDKLSPERQMAWFKKITAEPRISDNRPHYEEMLRLAHGNDEQKAEFMAHDFKTDRLLTPGSFKKFEEMQVKMRADPSGDPRLTFGLSQIDPIVREEITKSGALADFKGLFQNEIVSQMQQEGALKLTPEQYRTIGNNLAQKIATKRTGWFSWVGGGEEVPLTNKEISEYKAEHGGKMPEGITPSFQVPISIEERAAAKKLIQQVKPGYESSPEEEDMLIYADRHRRLYGAGPSKSQGRTP